MPAPPSFASGNLSNLKPFAPPSNVRATPNGNIVCSVRTRQAINIYGREGQWYLTDYCGGRGYIHEGQIRF